jgi:hypothetical protein
MRPIPPSKSCVKRRRTLAALDDLRVVDVKFDALCRR